MTAPKTTTYADALASKAAPRTEAAALSAVPATTRQEIVRELNQEYAVVLLGDRPAVLREGADLDGQPEIRLLTVGGFQEWLRPRRVWINDRPVPAAKVWLESDQRRQYTGITFAPGRDPGAASDASAGYYNLWKGFAVAPDPTASCARFLDHVAENVCGGDERHFAWVMGWFAQLVQSPGRKTGTALVLRGAQGVGKTIVGAEVGALLGAHYQIVADDRFVTGRFNSHLASCLLLQLEEATWGGDHGAAGKLKDLITGTHHLIEYKGREPVRVPNYVRVLITSNNEWVVPAGLEERRFSVLDVGDARRGDTTYFRALRAELDAGGRGALLHYLQTYDLSDVPIREVLATDALREQQIASLSPELAWWVDTLMTGALPSDAAGEGSSPCRALYDDYVAHGQRRNVSRRGGETALGLFLRKHVPELRRERRRTLEASSGRTVRQWIYEFPPLAECRAALWHTLRGDLPWSDPDAEWASPP